MLRGGIIGLGNVALHAHLPGWLERRDVEIVAMSDTDPARRAAWAERLPGARWYDSSDMLMADAPLDFVDICTPPSSHAPLIRHALARGLHVLCEKPLVGSLDDMRRLVKHATDADRVVHTVHNWHHAPIVRQTRRLLADGAIGQVTDVVWHTLRTQPASAAGGTGVNWRVLPEIAGGGILTDHGWHACYILHRWIGALPTTVSATLETRRHRIWQVEDTASIRLNFPDATAEVLLTWASDERRNWARLTGTAGTIEIFDDTLVLRSGREQRWSFASGLSDGSHHPDWFHSVAEQFVAAVSGEPADGGNLAEASLCVEVEAQARESHRRGDVELPLSMAASLLSRRRELSV